MGKNPVDAKKLDRNRPLHRRIAKQTRAGLRQSSKALMPRLIEKSSFDKEQLRLTFQVIDRQITDLIWVFDRPLLEDDAVTACGTHVDNCPSVNSPCSGLFFGGCSTQVHCESEACAASFACAGVHNCGENACASVTCHPDTFGCTDHVVPCTAEAPACTTETPPCATEATDCVIDLPPESCQTEVCFILETSPCEGDTPETCTQETCLIDEPTDACAGEDEGGILSRSRGGAAVRSLFSTEVWAAIVLQLAASKPSLDTRIRNTSITLDEDLFRDA